MKENGKIFGKINILDFIIILILLIMIGGAVYKFGFVDNTLYIPEYHEGVITIKAANLCDYECEALQKGDPMSVPKVQDLGEIIDIQFQPTIENQKSIDGKIYNVENPLLRDVVITIKCDELSYRSENYFVGKNYKVIAGQSLDASNGLFEFKATVTNVTIDAEK